MDMTWLDPILEFIKTNFGVTLTWAGIVAFLGAAGVYFLKVVTPKLMESLKVTFAVVISNLFGVSYGQGQDLVDKMPLMEKFDGWEKDMTTTLELKLIDYKKQLSSPLYTAAEKLAIQVMYEKLYKQIEARISKETKALLEVYEQKKG